MAKKKIQVFISSTYIDLIEERQSAVQAVLDSGHIPAGMELFKAGNETQLETIYKWIDNSDVYMLILGGRYGSVEESSQKSYTQLEYEYAINKGIPVFAVVLTNDFLERKSKSLGIDNVFEKNNIEKYDDFKELVLSKIVRMVGDSKDIMLTIHSTLTDFLEEYDLTGWVRADDTEANSTLLNQLNEINIENKKLRKEKDELSKKINDMTLLFESEIAFEGEEIIILGTYSQQSGYSGGIRRWITKDIEKSITWDKMFLLWAPYLVNTSNYISARDFLKTALKEHMGRSFSINENLFQTIKIQYSALGLIKNFEARTTKGGLAEFISLTGKGKNYLIKKSAIKKTLLT